jgi:hypothetical protein
MSEHRIFKLISPNCDILKTNKNLINKYFIAACKYNNLAVVKLLLQDDKINVTENDGLENDGLENAIKNNNVKIVETLLRDDRINSISNKSNMQWAVKNGHLSIFKLLMQNKNINLDGIKKYIIVSRNYKNRNEIIKILKKILIINSIIKKYKLNKEKIIIKNILLLLNKFKLNYFNNLYIKLIIIEFINWNCIINL